MSIPTLTSSCVPHLEKEHLSYKKSVMTLNASHYDLLFNLKHFSVWWTFNIIDENMDRLCGLVVRVPGYRSRGWVFDSRRYQTFWEVVGLVRGPLSLVSTTEELFERKSNGSGLEIREYRRRDPSRWPRGTLYSQKLPLTSPTSGCRSVGIVRLRTQAIWVYLPLDVTRCRFGRFR
jgi:hypothetical protein